MIWSASLILALIGSVPDEVATRVRDAVASTWRVPSAQVTLEWGPVAPAVEFVDGAAFRLLGTGKAGRFVVVIRAAGTRDIAVTLKAGRQDSVWVAARPLITGAIVAADDAHRVAQLVWGPPTDEETSPIGREVRRNLAAGDRLTSPAVIEPTVITPGDPVEFLWDGGPVRISRGGIAQTRARRGEPVWAQDASGSRMQGIATGPGRARLLVKGRTS